MYCATCGSENAAAARFCGSCGKRLSAACPLCGAQIASGLRFCTSCGGSVAEAGPPEPERAGPAAAERRRISVLFVDLENFTALAESLDPEEVRAIQSSYFEVARSTVASYGGTIEKFIGDAVMAVWGAPAAHEDDPERAVRAAIAIVGGVSGLGAGTGTSGTRLGARAAVTTGEAAVTLGATGQGMVAGDLVNVAARLQARAPVAGVLVDAATKLAAGPAASFERVGSLSLKGRSTRISAFRVAAGGLPPAARRGGAYGGPFVGRQRELRELSGLFDGVAREKRSRLVTVTGIAGIGKSRLAHELREKLGDEVIWLAGRAPAYGDGITFEAVAEMVRQRLGIPDGARLSAEVVGVGVALGGLIPDEQERRWVEPRLSALLGEEQTESFERDELFAAWRRFFEGVSERTPTVLVFEDLQWADPSLLDFIEHVGSWARDTSILILALTRPELLDRRTGWGSGLGSFTHLHLDRLPDAAMRQLLAEREPRLADPLIGKILERAGGVPLYAVEVIRIFDRPADRQRTGGRRGAPQSAEGEPAGEVPDSLHGVIAARIDALPPTERRLLLAASVLGRRFDTEAMVAVAGPNPSNTREGLDALMRRELLTLDAGTGGSERGSVAFVQDLVREVAYGTLARSERRTLHLAAARHLESNADEDGRAESLAGHLVEVYRMSPEHPDAVRIARRAVAALRTAATNAMRLHLPERALTMLEQALTLTGGVEQRAAVLDEAATAARAAARLDRAEQHLRDLVAQQSLGESAGGAAHARAGLASVLLMAQRNDSALEELESALEAIGDIGTDVSSVELAAQLARARLLTGDNRSAVDWAERALTAARALGLDAIVADLIVTRGSARYQLGDEEAGRDDLRLAIEAAGTAGSLSTELRAHNNLAWLSVSDDPRATLETAQAGYALATRMGIGDMGVQLADVACAAAIETGDWAWALETAAALEQRGLVEAYRMDLSAICAIIHALQGRANPLASLDAMASSPDGLDRQIGAGIEYARAWAAFVAGALEEARALAAAASRDSSGAELAHHYVLGARASLWLGDRPAVVKSIRDLNGIGLSGRAQTATALTLEAGLEALDADPAASDHYERADAAWRDLRLPVPLVLSQLDRHRIGGAAEPLPRETAQILESLGADGLLSAVAAGTGVSPRSAARRPAQSRRPTAGTEPRKGEARRPPRGTGRRAPPG